MKKVTYNFINPNTDDEMADYVSKVLTKAIANTIVYADGLDKLINARSEIIPDKIPKKGVITP
jgi:hypothetical protein